MNRKKTVLIFSTSGSDNTGDDAILLGAVRLIREILPNQHLSIVTTDVSKTPKIEDSTLIQHDLNSGPRIETLFRVDFIGIFKHMFTSRLVIFAGGTILHDSHPLNLLYFLSMTLLARILRKKVVYIGVGVNNISTKFGKILTKIIGSLSDSIYLRDRISADKISDLGIKKHNVGTDLAFLVEYPIKKPRKEFLHFIKSNSSKKLFGFSVYGKYNQENHLKRYYNLDTEAKILAGVGKSFIDEYNARLIMIPNELPADRTFLKQIYNNIKNKKEILFIEERLNPIELVNLLRTLDFNFNMRLHSVIFSIIAGTPFLNLEYAPKVTSLLKSYNLLETSITFSEVSTKNIINKTDFILKNSNRIKSKLKEIYEKEKNTELFKDFRLYMKKQVN